MGSAPASALTSLSTMVVLTASSNCGEPEVDPAQLMMASGLL